MNIQEYLLTCLGEEGSEVAQDCSKANRFGLHQKSTLEPDGPDNTERLVKEINEFVAVVEMLAQRGILPHNWVRFDIRDKKRQRVIDFMEKSRQLGTLK